MSDRQPATLFIRCTHANPCFPALTRSLARSHLSLSSSPRNETSVPSSLQQLFCKQGSVSHMLMLYDYIKDCFQCQTKWYPLHIVVEHGRALLD